MKWTEICKVYPNQWLVIEALSAVTTLDNHRSLKKIAVIEQCIDGNHALENYRRLHKQYPAREFYFVHTSRAVLDIREQNWAGIRRGNAFIADR